jgi:hypothetical protein
MAPFARYAMPRFSPKGRGSGARAPPPRPYPRWYRGAIVWGRCRVLSNARRARRTALIALPVAAVALASGCGAARQDAGEAKGSYEMKVERVSFPARQSIAHPASFALQVSNTGSKTVPNLAVTLDSFYYTEHFPELAADKRPVWVIERGPGPQPRPPVSTQEVSQPGGGQTAYVSTWALGPLAPKGTRTFVWSVVPVKPGTYTVRYRIAAGLAGKATAKLKGGGSPQGQFTASIAGVPPSTHVNPSTGRVVAGTFPAIP